MEMQFEFAKNWNEWGFGFCREFAQLGMATLIVGPAHLQLSVDIDRADDFAEALGSPWGALRAWISDRLQIGSFAHDRI